MSEKEIKKRIEALMNKGESTEVEFKSARGGMPASLWETYSAFANTNGGVIVLGIQEKNHKHLLEGLTKETAIRYQKIFWDLAHNRGKVSACLPKTSDVRIEEIDGSYILLCEELFGSLLIERELCFNWLLRSEETTASRLFGGNVGLWLVFNALF